MKRTVIVTETKTYFIEVDVPEGMDEYDAEILAMKKWRADPEREHDDYDVDYCIQEGDAE